MFKFSSCQLTAITIIAIASGLVSCIAFFPKDERGGVFTFANGLIGIGATYLRLPSNEQDDDK